MSQSQNPITDQDRARTAKYLGMSQDKVPDGLVAYLREKGL